MGDAQQIKLNVFILLSILPLSAAGYFFAVYKEALFFLYEWLLALVILVSFILSIKGTFGMKSNLKWISFSILAFLVQLSVLALFLGPFTENGLFYVFYFVSACTFAVYLAAFRKARHFKFLLFAFSFVSILFTGYMILLNSLWGSSLAGL